MSGGAPMLERYRTIVAVPAPGTTALPGGNGAVRRARHDFDALTFDTAAAI